jgi:hypothetical protein
MPNPSEADLEALKKRLDIMAMTALIDFTTPPTCAVSSTNAFRNQGTIQELVPVRKQVCGAGDYFLLA